LQGQREGGTNNRHNRRLNVASTNVFPHSSGKRDAWYFLFSARHLPDGFKEKLGLKELIVKQRSGLASWMSLPPIRRK
jgi:hypothetical protein